ncbi:unnamed protein product [Polarella glacialis]|uniref:Peptidase C2 calpain domain-containing protein n=1 Tax=Polarella glacialis TaxID=89957 RepID=A0A813DAL4_POLGL|nr:unnamed protein product [Polarella glacialis]
MSRAAARGESEFVLVVSQNASKAPFNFTLQVCTDVPCTLAQLPPLVPEDYSSGAVRGQWTRRSAGGCSNSLWSYAQNPQWCLQVPDGGLADLMLILECPAGQTVNLRVFKGNVARPDSLRLGATSSGAYRRGCCFLRVSDLAPGPHIVVVSTFRPDVCADYRLAWHAPRPIRLRPQPHPFVDGALAHPLLCSVRVLRPGQRLRLKIDLANGAPGAEVAHVSLRLQTGCTKGQLPLVEICNAKDGTQPVPCERLEEADAEQYFQASGAVVVLLADLLPGESYVLRAQAPRQPFGNRDEAKLYITSDQRLLLDSSTSSKASAAARPRRRH